MATLAMPVAAAVGGWGACGGGDESDSGAAPTIDVRPATATVSASPSPSANASPRPHSVTGTFDGKKVESPTQSSGEFSFTFEKSGTFSYQCAVHGRGMTGEIKIEGGG